VDGVTIGNLQRTWQGLPPAAVDAGVAAVVAVAVTLTISVATEEDATRSPDALAYLLGLTVAALLLARRLWPMGVLIASIGVLFVYYSLEYPAFSPAVPLAAAAYFAATAGHIRAAAAILGGVVLFGVGWQTLGEDKSLASVVGTGTLADISLLAAVLLLGEAVRNRRAWAEEVRLRLQRAEEDRERDAARRVEEERLHIARELHDVLAHTVAALNVQAGVAADVIDDDPEQAKTALRTIRKQSRAAMSELKATVGLLRAGATDAPRTPAPSLAELDALVQMVGVAGVEVEVSVAGGARPLPGAIDLTAYRILQESLTNVVRHADASAARVLIRYDPEAVVVQVEDDGRAAARPANGAGGYGLSGMRERAAAVGGTLEAGQRPGGGFRVHAELPTGGERP
jgi:signal transduction histidine kinase